MMIHILEVLLELLWGSLVVWSCDPQSSREILKQRSGNFMDGGKIKFLLQEGICVNRQGSEGRFFLFNILF